MAKVGFIELRINQTEGFRVRIKHPDGSDVRSDRTRLPTWTYERAAKDAWTVAVWKRERFEKSYPGFNVDVLDGEGNVAHGGMLLENVRETYED